MDLTDDPDHPVVLTGSPLSSTEHDRLRPLLEAQLDRYPPGVLKAPDGSKTILGSVLVFRTLSVNGSPVAGTYYPGLVFLAAEAFPIAGAEQDAYLARALHHEVSSLLLLTFRRAFDEARFRAALPPGFVYADEAAGADPAQVFAATNSIRSIQHLADGFLATYADRNIEQDLNSYAELLLWKPELLLRTFAPDSRVGQKARIVRDFYIAIDPRFEALLTPGEK